MVKPKGWSSFVRSWNFWEPVTITASHWKQIPNSSHLDRIHLATPREKDVINELTSLLGAFAMDFLSGKVRTLEATCRCECCVQIMSSLSQLGKAKTRKRIYTTRETKTCKHEKKRDHGKIIPIRSMHVLFVDQKPLWHSMKYWLLNDGILRLHWLMQ